MSSDLQQYIKAQMEDPGFREAWRWIELGETLAAARCRAGITVKQLAKLIRTTPEMIEQMEQDPEMVDRALLISAIDLLQPHDPPPEAPVQGEPQTHRREMTLRAMRPLLVPGATPD